MNQTKEVNNINYTIDEITPNEGFNLTTMINDGDYTLVQVGSFNDLEEAMAELESLRLDNKDKDYDLRNTDQVIMGVMQGVIFID